MGRKAVVGITERSCCSAKEVDEDVRFNEKAVSLLGAGRGVGVGTLWNVAETWLAFSAIVRREKSRLLARKGLRKLFGGPEVVGDTVPLPEGWSDGFASEDDGLDGRIEFL